jgi:hypothetical protein
MAAQAASFFRKNLKCIKYLLRDTELNLVGLVVVNSLIPTIRRNKCLNVLII